MCEDNIIGVYKYFAKYGPIYLTLARVLLKKKYKEATANAVAKRLYTDTQNKQGATLIPSFYNRRNIVVLTLLALAAVLQGQPVVSGYDSI